MYKRLKSIFIYIYIYIVLQILLPKLVNIRIAKLTTNSEHFFNCSKKVLTQKKSEIANCVGIWLG